MDPQASTWEFDRGPAGYLSRTCVVRETKHLEAAVTHDVKKDNGTLTFDFVSLVLDLCKKKMSQAFWVNKQPFFSPISEDQQDALCTMLVLIPFFLFFFSFK